jgi:hypothetical protein
MPQSTIGFLPLIAEFRTFIRFTALGVAPLWRQYALYWCALFRVAP